MLRTQSPESTPTTSGGGDVHGGARTVTLAGVSRLGPGRFLLMAHLGGRWPAIRDAQIVFGGSDAEARPAWRVIDLEDGIAGQARQALLMIGRGGEPREEGRDALTVEITCEDSDPPATLEVYPDSFVGLRTLLRDQLAGLDPGARALVAETVIEFCTGDASPDGRFSLGRHLVMVRNALREPHAPCPRGPNEARGLNVDGIYALDASGFWIRGWFVDRDARLRRLTAVSPEGYRAELFPSLYRCTRKDVEVVYSTPPEPPESVAGFLAHFELPAPSYEADGWVVEMENDLGDCCEVLTPPVVRDSDSVREAIFGDFAQHEDTELGDAHVRPAMACVQANVHRAGIDSVVQYGDPPKAPDVTVVVPLYKQVDFLELQLAHFQHDPDLSGADLVYVLDSPEQKAELDRRARQLHALYGIPFRVVAMERNVGFAGANNAGVSVARGPLLLLLNSDVLPDAPGWLGRMMAFYRGKPNLGALGPKLLFEDETIQHAGLYFSRAADAEVWENSHYFKGMHRSFGPACRSRSVPAVTGACVMVDRELFTDLGGLSGAYVQGDYEDSDLCMRLLELGRVNWYMADVELYHLEAQSYPNSVRRDASRYNRWLHSRLWSARIEHVMEAFDDDGSFGSLGR